LLGEEYIGLGNTGGMDARLLILGLDCVPFIPERDLPSLCQDHAVHNGMRDMDFRILELLGNALRQSAYREFARRRHCAVRRTPPGASGTCEYQESSFSIFVDLRNDGAQIISAEASDDLHVLTANP